MRLGVESAGTGRSSGRRLHVRRGAVWERAPRAALACGALRVLLLATYPLRAVPGQRFRFEQYLEPLAAHGIHIDVSCLLNQDTMRLLHQTGNLGRKASSVIAGALHRIGDLRRSRSYDAVFVAREAYPLGPAWVERMLRALDVPYIFDFDDAVYLPTVSEANRLVAPLKLPSKTTAIARHANLVLAGNEHLAAWARHHNDNVRVVPTTIDTRQYVPANPEVTGDPPCIGWSGSTTTVQHLITLAPVLREVQRRHGARLRVIGDARFTIRGAVVDARAWHETTELQDLQGIDIGVMPLPDEEWAQGKCGLKALQYMALGIPTVMSPVGVNVEIAEGGAALLAGSPQEWIDALDRLIADPALRRELSAAGRRRVEERYSVDANVDRYVSAIRSATRS